MIGEAALGEPDEGEAGTQAAEDVHPDARHGFTVLPAQRRQLFLPTSRGISLMTYTPSYLQCHCRFVLRWRLVFRHTSSKIRHMFRLGTICRNWMGPLIQRYEADKASERAQRC